MPRVFFADTYYPDFIASMPLNGGTYEQELSRILAAGFGTSDFMSAAMTALGWECADTVCNHSGLQRLWAEENCQIARYAGDQAVLLEQIRQFRPGVLFLQDIGFVIPETLSECRRNGVLVAAQCSCPMPSRNIEYLDIAVTSFPHYVDKFSALGVPRVEYLPLAFDPRMLQYGVDRMIDRTAGLTMPEKWTEIYGDTVDRFAVGERGERDIDISFVGGVGRNSHWARGTDVLEAVAYHFGDERFHWYGYGLENLQDGSHLRKCYRGEAYGRDMYAVYGRSKIVVGRHGEVAQGFTNALRTYEATGMGALLMTEQSPNLKDLFPAKTVIPYSGPNELIFNIECALNDESTRQSWAMAGQAHTLKHHTYSQRMQTVSSVLSECIEARKVAQ